MRWIASTWKDTGSPRSSRGGGDVLDVACGIGYGSSVLREGGAAHVLGVDISQEAIDYARQHFARADVAFHVDDCFTVNGKFDLVVSLETIEHLERGDEWPAKIASLLKPSGLAIISTPCRIGGTIEDRPANPYHVREYSPDEFGALLRKEFADVRLMFQGFRMPEVCGNALSRIAKRLFTYPQLRRAVMEEIRPVLTVGEWFARYDCKPTFMLAVCSSH